MHFMRFLTIISDFELKNFFFDFLGPMTRFHQKCLSQDIVQAGTLILFLVYFYDSYLQHIKSCQGKVDFEMNLRISLVVMNFHPTLTMLLELISILKILCLILLTTWMENHEIVRILPTGVVSQQISRKEAMVFLVFLKIVSIRVAPCLSRQISQQNAKIWLVMDELVNDKPQRRWEI